MPGLDEKLIQNLDFATSCDRIIRDMSTDFIYAPHYKWVFIHASQELTSLLQDKLVKCKYNPSTPIKVEVPKRSGFTRPGAILIPTDRLIYQALIDPIVFQADQLIDRQHVFSYELSDLGIKENMFKSGWDAIERFKQSAIEFARSDQYKNVLVADISNYFERLNQHFLVNALVGCVDEPRYIKLIEKILSGWSEKISCGILQGMWPSDFLGNFYMCLLDLQLSLKKHKFVRYMDDYKIFFEDENHAKKSLLELTKYLRTIGLNLNENKTHLFSVDELITEEDEIDRLKKEVEKEYKELLVDIVGYGYEGALFDEDDVDIEDADLTKLELLFEKRISHVNAVEKIDRLCFPLLTRLRHKIAVPEAIGGMIKRPHLTNLYVSYLNVISRDEPEIIKDVERIFLNDENIIFDWQRMWISALLYNAENISEEAVKKAHSNLTTKEYSPALRAVSACMVGRHGNALHKKTLRSDFGNEESSYVREAILYSTKYFSSHAERNTCLSGWGKLSETKALIAQSIRNEETVSI